MSGLAVMKKRIMSPGKNPGKRVESVDAPEGLIDALERSAAERSGASSKQPPGSSLNPALSPARNAAPDPESVSNIVISASSAMTRAGLSSLLEGNPQINVVGTASGLPGLDETLERLRPDVLLIERPGRLPDGFHEFEPAFLGRGGFLTGNLALDSGAPEVPTVLLTDEPGLGLLNERIRGVLPRTAGSREIAAAIAAAAAGLLVIHREARHVPGDDFGSDSDQAGLDQGDVNHDDPPERVRSSSGPHRAEQTHNPRLSAREVEVLRLLAEGVANKEIAWRLGISEHTVKFHVASLFQKLNAGTRTEAVAIGFRQGLIPL